MYVPKHLKVIDTPDKGLAVVAREKIKVGEVVCELFFDSLYSAQPSGFATQVWD